jgi:hypothetical protein
MTAIEVDMAPITALLDRLWRDYVALTPQAERIHALMASRGDAVRNDHVALRCFGEVGIAALARPFEALGWRAKDHYRFEDKHLRARYWKHERAGLPKVFISELCTDELSPPAQAIVGKLVAQLPGGFANRDDLPWAGRPWRVTRGEYETLLGESEYAAWVAAFGFHVNHFTVDVRSLKTFADLGAVNAWLVEHGFVLNAAGGAIKGTPGELLEQSSTRADEIDVTFADGVARIPSVYYEFARRYPMASGELFEGFVTRSADKIFESTDVRR